MFRSSLLLSHPLSITPSGCGCRVPRDCPGEYSNDQVVHDRRLSLRVNIIRDCQAPSQASSCTFPTSVIISKSPTCFLPFPCWYLGSLFSRFLFASFLAIYFVFPFRSSRHRLIFCISSMAHCHSVISYILPLWSTCAYATPTCPCVSTSYPNRDLEWHWELSDPVISVLRPSLCWELEPCDYLFAPLCRLKVPKIPPQCPKPKVSNTTSQIWPSSTRNYLITRRSTNAWLRKITIWRQ